MVADAEMLSNEVGENEIVKTYSRPNNKRLSHSHGMMPNANKCPRPLHLLRAVSFIFGALQINYVYILTVGLVCLCYFFARAKSYECYSLSWCSMIFIRRNFLCSFVFAMFRLCFFQTQQPFVILSLHLLCDSLCVFSFTACVVC